LHSLSFQWLKNIFFNSSSKPIDFDLTCIKAKFLSRSFWFKQHCTYFAYANSFFSIKVGCFELQPLETEIRLKNRINLMIELKGS